MINLNVKRCKLQNKSNKKSLNHISISQWLKKKKSNLYHKDKVGYHFADEKQIITITIFQDKLVFGSKNSTPINCKHYLLLTITHHKSSSVHHMRSSPHHQHRLWFRWVSPAHHRIHRLAASDTHQICIHTCDLV